MAKNDFEKVFGTVKASKKNWDVEKPKTKKNKKKGKNNKKDLFGRKTSNGKSSNKKKKSLDKAIIRMVPKKKSDAWLPIDTNEIGNLSELISSELAGVFRIVFQFPECQPFMLIAVSDGNDGVYMLGGGKAIDICMAVAECMGNPCTTETDYAVMKDKLSSGKPFESIEFLNTSLIIEI